jgi:hypothetical protein
VSRNEIFEEGKQLDWHESYGKQIVADLKWGEKE